MRRITTGWAAVLVALATLAAPAPAATPLEWRDPEGDATGLHLLSSSPRPSDEALDVTRVRMERRSDRLVWTAAIKKLPAGAPPGATGYEFRFYFTFGDTAFQFMVEEETTLGGGGVFFYPEDNATEGELSCARCVGRIDRKTSTVVLEAPIASVAAGLRSFDRSLPPFAPGARLEAPYVWSQRLVGYLTLTADEAVSPAGTVFTL